MGIVENSGREGKPDLCRWSGESRFHQRRTGGSGGSRLDGDRDEVRLVRSQTFGYGVVDYAERPALELHDPVLDAIFRPGAATTVAGQDHRGDRAALFSGEAHGSILRREGRR